jgi:hypothetical protein
MCLSFWLLRNAGKLPQARLVRYACGDAPGPGVAQQQWERRADYVGGAQLPMTVSFSIAEAPAEWAWPMRSEKCVPQA